MNDKERFIKLCESVNREGFDNFMEWIEKSDFFVAPASTIYHGACRGGLLKHSLNVYDELKRMLKAFPEVQVSEETAVIVSLFHDVCKANFYGTEKRNRKNKYGNWESYDRYVVDEQFCYGGHGSKSVYLLQKFIKLEDEEAVAINCHMGAWDGNKDVRGAYTQFPLAFLLHIADESATFMLEKEG